jgi:hypothetical protein
MCIDGKGFFSLNQKYIPQSKGRSAPADAKKSKACQENNYGHHTRVQFVQARRTHRFILPVIEKIVK